MNHKFAYKWYLKDGYPAPNIEKNNLNVFGTFICGGGSTMGYKLAGFNHLGGVEIDKKVAEVYRLNHNPKYLFVEDIREFNKRTDLPNELYNLDLLDGSPPCSTFSMAGSREKAWGKSKQFREGQAKQVLDDLVFVYIDTIEKLKPKVCLLENVKGIIQGNAKWYSKEIVKRLETIGYDVQVFLLNAASMGVPQKRERVFFIGKRKDLKLPKLELKFEEKGITFGEISDMTDNREKLKPCLLELYEKVTEGSSFSTQHPQNYYFNNSKAHNNLVSSTITSDTNGTVHNIYKRYLNKLELTKIGTYPVDYNFTDLKPKYLIGMSVPPVMTAQIAHQIYLQLFRNNNNGI